MNQWHSVRYQMILFTLSNVNMALHAVHVLTWADHSSILSMGACSSTPPGDSTFWEASFIPLTHKHIRPDASTPLTKPLCPYDSHSSPTVQLMAEHAGGIHIPGCITHWAPFAEVLELHSARAGNSAICQSGICVSWAGQRQRGGLCFHLCEQVTL